MSGGRLRRLFRGVYLVGTVLPPLALEQAALVYAGSGAALSHLSAGALWGLTQRPPQVHLIAPGRRVRSKPDLHPHVHQLERHEITRRQGLSVTTPEQDLSSFLDRPTHERITNEAEVRRLIATSREATPTRSTSERRLVALLGRAGLTPDATNARLAGWEVDVLYRDRRLVVELDGFAFHRTRAAFERDRRKDAALTVAGFRVLRFTWRQLEHEPERLVAAVASA